MFLCLSFLASSEWSLIYVYPTLESQSPASSTPSTPVQSRLLTPSLSSASPGPFRPDGLSHSPTRSRLFRVHSTSSIDLSTFTAIQVARQVSLTVWITGNLMLPRPNYKCVCVCVCVHAYTCECK